MNGADKKKEEGNPPEPVFIKSCESGVSGYLSSASRQGHSFGLGRGIEQGGGAPKKSCSLFTI